MMIEIHGAGFRNKGGELMLRTAIAEIRKRLPEAQFAIDPTVGPYAKRAKLELRQIIPPRWWMGSRRFRVGLMAQRAISPLLTSTPLSRFTDMYGGAALSQIDALVDVSGFAFTDQWGTAPMHDFTRLAQAYKKQGKPVVMLPQGFGPFEKSESRQAAQELASVPDLIYARDKVSYQHIDPGSHNDHIRLGPDITLFYPEMIQHVTPAQEARYSCIIPNVRMLKQGKEKWEGRYEDVLVHIGNTLHDSGEKVLLLIHDTSGDDKDIAQRVQQRMSSPPEIVERQNPVDLKQVVAESKVVITSRYHGAIAAFSKGVPSLCMGWAHKYEALYEDFGVRENMISPLDTKKDISEKTKKIVETSENERERKSIYENLDKMKDKSNNLWENVINTIK